MNSYSMMILLPTFEERFQYLQEGIVHSVGFQTFGSLRYTNQRLYNSTLWRHIRDEVIVRDGGCDLAIPGFVIHHKSLIRVHHINPLTPEMFDEENPLAYDLENLVCMHVNTHRMLTYGGDAPKMYTTIERKPNDHILWKKE